MLSRRQFLSYFPGFLSSPLVSRLLLPSQQTPLPLSLFMTEEDLHLLRERYQLPAFQSLRESLSQMDYEASYQFINEEIRYNDHLYDIARIGNEAPDLAFKFLMEGDQDAGELAVAFIRALMQFPKWDYFLEDSVHVVGIQRASSSTVAAALCSDWLAPLISDEERKSWLQTMADRGCEACYLSIYGMRYPERVVGWSMDPTSTYLEHRPGDKWDLSNWPTILDTTNLKAVPASALAIGAIAYEKEFEVTEKTSLWIEQAVFSLTSYKSIFAKDGTYDENVSYADYTARHLIQAYEVLQRHRSINISDSINWPGFTDFLIEMSLPTRDNPFSIVNFGDAGNGMRSSVPYWLASNYYDPHAQWFAQDMSYRHDLWAILWSQPEAPAEAPPARPHIWKSDLDWIVGRTGYTETDLVVAMRSGGPMNHEHADRNSIILKCYGEQLVADPHRPPYSFSDPSWMLRSTAGHSALLIDGKGHIYHDGSEGTNPSTAHATIVRQIERASYFSWTSDATNAYEQVNADVAAVTRTVIVLFDLPVVLILDKVVKKTTPSVLHARHFGFNLDGAATITPVEDSSFEIKRPHALLHGTGFCDHGVRIETVSLPIPAEVARLHPAVDVITENASQSPLLITVLRPAATNTEPASYHAETTPEGHQVFHFERGNFQKQCTIINEGEIPEFKVT